MLVSSVPALRVQRIRLGWRDGEVASGGAGTDGVPIGRLLEFHFHPS